MMGSGAENSELAWLTTLFADEGALRQIFARHPELVKELLRNKGFLDTLFDAKRGAFAMLLATPAELRWPFLHRVHLWQYRHSEGCPTSTNYAITFRSGTLTVMPAPLTATGIDFAAIVGVAQDFTVAQYTDSDPSAHTGGYAVPLDFGDGTPVQAGTVTQPDGPGTPFYVDAIHTYTQTGTFTVDVRIYTEADGFAETFSTATVIGAGAPQGPGGGLASSPRKGLLLAANGVQATGARVRSYCDPATWFWHGRRKALRALSTSTSKAGTWS
jgi:hypothetical protein